MALPVLVKAWQNSINQTVLAQGSITLTAQRLMRTLKNLLIGFGSNPWVVRSSCNGAGGAGSFGNSDLVDRWIADGNLVGAAAGVNHSWIVLRQTGIAANYEICIELLNAALGTVTIAISPSAAFGSLAVGSATARPTATDEIIILNNTTWFSNNDATHQIHAQLSTDGQCTRVNIWRATTNQCTFLLIDKPLNPPAGWVNPSIAIFLATTVTIAATNSLLHATAIGNGRGTTAILMKLTEESNVDGLLSQIANIGNIPDDTDSAWPFFPVGITSTTAANRGWKGTLADIWWSPIGVADADTFPNNAAARQFVRFAGFIFPWTGGADVPLLV